MIIDGLGNLFLIKLYSYNLPKVIQIVHITEGILEELKTIFKQPIIRTVYQLTGF